MNSAVILITGPDATKFLQGQLTCDVKNANNSSAILGAICNNKGRVVASFWLWKDNESFAMVLPKEMTTIVIPVLKKYARFSKVHIEESETHSHQPPTLLESIRNGFAVITPVTSGEFTPHELAYPQIGAISFAKGCYTGQEIVARVHYRGKSKQHLFHVQLPNENPDMSLSIINIEKTDDDVYEALVVASDLSASNIKVIKQYA